jgi:hypothetical protein
MNVTDIQPRRAPTEVTLPKLLFFVGNAQFVFDVLQSKN